MRHCCHFPLLGGGFPMVVLTAGSLKLVTSCHRPNLSEGLWPRVSMRVSVLSRHLSRISWKNRTWLAYEDEKPELFCAPFFGRRKHVKLREKRSLQGIQTYTFVLQNCLQQKFGAPRVPNASWQIVRPALTSRAFSALSRHRKRRREKDGRDRSSDGEDSCEKLETSDTCVAGCTAASDFSFEDFGSVVSKGQSSVVNFACSAAFTRSRANEGKRATRRTNPKHLVKPDFVINSSEIQKLVPLRFTGRCLLVTDLESDARAAQLLEEDARASASQLAERRKHFPLGGAGSLRDKANLSQVSTNTRNVPVLLGFDTESQPSISARATRTPVAVVQVSAQNVCGIWQLSRLGGMPPHLHRLLTSSSFIKVGHGARGDILRLHEEFGMKPANFLDLHFISCHLGCNPRSLRAIAALFLGKRLIKEEQLSDWSKSELSNAQIHYAATDAWASLQVLLAIRSFFCRPDKPLSAEKPFSIESSLSVAGITTA